MLVTNPTMLEYMLIRAEDAPILQASQGKLRWIVLDEAHTYTGAKAAELALLLRRIMLAFGVRSEDVHFVATSASLGGDGAEQQLQRFLASLAGLPLGRVHVVRGQRAVPSLPKAHFRYADASYPELMSLPDAPGKRLYRALCANKTAQRIRDAFIAPEGSNVQTLSSIVGVVAGGTESTEEGIRLREWLETAGSSLVPGVSAATIAREVARITASIIPSYGALLDVLLLDALGYSRSLVTYHLRLGLRGQLPVSVDWERNLIDRWSDTRYWPGRSRKIFPIAVSAASMTSSGPLMPASVRDALVASGLSRNAWAHLARLPATTLHVLCHALERLPDADGKRLFLNELSFWLSRLGKGFRYYGIPSANLTVCLVSGRDSFKCLV